MSDARRQPLVMPGGLVAVTALWMITAVVLALGPRSPVQPSAATFEPAVRIILLCMGIGLYIAWPLLRLSQQRTAYPARQTVLDLVVLVPLLQLVVWLPRVLTVWSVSRTAAISALMAAWAVLIGALVAAVIGSDRSGPRNLVMIVCLAMCLMGPMVVGLGPLDHVDAATIVQLGPLLGVRALTEGGSSPATHIQWMAVLVVCGTAVSAWLAVMVASLWSGRRASQQSS